MEKSLGKQNRNLSITISDSHSSLAQEMKIKITSKFRCLLLENNILDNKVAHNVPGLTQSGPGTRQAGEIGYLAFSANLRQPLN
jgi:hypothetical protein